MTRATLADVLVPALQRRYAVAGVVCLGWEDARAYVAAAEAEHSPIILQVGPGARAHMPLSVWGPMLRGLADEAHVPVVIHLDHGYTDEEIAQAIEEGFTSVMFDGSQLPLAENIARTARYVDMAHEAGISCEGEIGFVGYQDGAASDGTDPDEAEQFARETGVDAVAVSIGNVHLQEQQAAAIDLSRLSAIEARTNVPLVLHGGSGVPHSVRADLARSSNICKFNIGTELRRVFGAALRDALARDAVVYDRIAVLRKIHDPLVTATRSVLAGLR